MATFKHISSKNADYGSAEKYLTFAHDEFSMKPTLDENGRPIPREDYRISTLNCGDEDFAIACMRANLCDGKERVFDVINRRKLSRKPMIITTNIALSVMQKATDLDDRRIYDHILEVCVPILFDGTNFCEENAAENLKKAAQILNL